MYEGIAIAMLLDNAFLSSSLGAGREFVTFAGYPVNNSSNKNA
jgi:hypothetical protein